MILPLRIALFILGIVFAYFFGETLERFLLEVVRYFVALESSNALFFNAIHLLIMLAPLLLFGLLIATALSGEPQLQSRFYVVLGGTALGLISFRIYQIWWVFRGGIGVESGSWSESLSVGQLYFLEKIAPFVILGVISASVVAITEKETKKVPLYSLVAPLCSFFWLFFTHKIQNLDSNLQIFYAILVSCISGLLIAFPIKLIREF